MSLQEQLLSAELPPFYTANATKSSAASYLRQYRKHQRLAATRGLIPGLETQEFDESDEIEYGEGRREESNALVLARLRKIQSSLHSTLTQIDADLERLRKNLMLTRTGVRVRAACIALIVSVFLSIMTRQGNAAGIVNIPRSLQPYIPLIPSPIAIYYIAAREQQISAVVASRARVEELRVAVASAYHVSSEEVEWLDQEKWDGVDFSRIGI
ncbi:hypothetical protein CC80DRAFT_588385 [Byssothecium circinans]|uniref:Uncharacterized protein n=1 Tax=Byssothecium circinans TaxID=147558 RepID=A0A6A5UDA3_9PLEO|nr:hypothetical protein CC80DRAFT_588385 [Byssothecium circinans]